MSHDHSFKLLMVGDSGVGKSSILLRFADDQFDPSIGSTIGIDFKMKTLAVNHQGKDLSLSLKIWDTAGQERFRTLTSSYYRGAHGVILVYSISDRESFNHVGTWLREVDSFKTFDDVAKLLVGNKRDLEEERAVSREEAQAVAQEHGMLWIECSAKTKEGIRQAFTELSCKILDTSSLVAPTRQPSSGGGVQLGDQRESAAASRGGYCC
eukprot:Hpha_TRINITY_DN15765_c0_g1::TRINITY_DN15765_c0_g1_i1::g.39498::m.39498/K07910/RAB18; Ras-related protein Rab-18